MIRHCRVNFKLSRLFLWAVLLGFPMLFLACSQPGSSEVNSESSGKEAVLEAPREPVDLPSENTIELVGDTDFVARTQNALGTIKKSAKAYELITKYLGRIQQASSSSMLADVDPPTYAVGSHTYNSSVTWYASTIVHDSYHSKLFHDYLALNGNVPGDIWTGETAEMMCLEIQIAFLEEIAAPRSEIEHAKSLRGSNWWSGAVTW